MKSDVKSKKDKPAGGRISIGVATRRRPAMLEQCLRSLTAQAVPDGTELVIGNYPPLVGVSFKLRVFGGFG